MVGPAYGRPFKQWAATQCSGGRNRSMPDFPTFDADSASNVASHPRRSPPTSADIPMPFDIPLRALPAALAAVSVLSVTLPAQQPNAHESAPVPVAGAAVRTSPVSIDG